ncbi:hypothetical protein BC629DRAFT_1447263 [Irpex lacteus]|nr:hypothetical protein BC629DRAFT_1447263 [Irpex lacteus]
MFIVPNPGDDVPYPCELRGPRGNATHIPSKTSHTPAHTTLSDPSTSPHHPRRLSSTKTIRRDRKKLADLCYSSPPRARARPNLGKKRLCKCLRDVMDGVTESEGFDGGRRCGIFSLANYLDANTALSLRHEDKYQDSKPKVVLRQESSRTDDEGHDWDPGPEGYWTGAYGPEYEAIGRYERSERMFGDVLSSLDAHVTARMAESEYLFKFGCVESGDIEVAWLNTGRRGTRWSK